MLVTPLPGTDRTVIRDLLERLGFSAANKAGAHEPTDLDRNYYDWADEAARMLRSCVRAEDIGRLVHTPTYWELIRAAHVESTRWTYLRREELRQRADAFAAAHKAIKNQIDRWSQLARFLVPDTGFFEGISLAYGRGSSASWRAMRVVRRPIRARAIHAVR
jgi:hypothetical protein